MTTVDEFDDPAPAKIPEKSEKTIRGEVPMGHANRYKLPHPITGKPGLWSRASTVAKILDDTYNLDRWKERVIAKGMGMRPDLGEVAASLDVTEHKTKLNDIVNKAFEAAGGSVRANLGTALHGYAERQDAGEVFNHDSLRASTRRDLDAYRAGLEREHLELIPDLMERVVFHTGLNICGRIDRALICPWWSLPRIGDLKTGKTMDFGGNPFAIQCYIYATSEYMWDETSGTWTDQDGIERTGQWLPFPPMNGQEAFIMHLPVGEANLKFKRVKLLRAKYLTDLAMRVQSARKDGKLMMEDWVNDLPYRHAIENAASVEDLSEVWRQATAAGKWSGELQALGKKKQQELAIAGMKKKGTK